MTATDVPRTQHGDYSLALDNEILRTIVGSHVHGIAIEGTDDRDEMSIYVEPLEIVLSKPPTHYIERTQPEGHRSKPGDLDFTAYSFRKYAELATKGNPSVLLPLFAPQDMVLVASEAGRALRRDRAMFLSQQAVQRFLGYMHSQHERMLGRGKRNRVPKRPELIEKYGWDTKFGAHALRLAYQGYELVSKGTLVLPLEPAERDVVLAVKQGQMTRDDVSRLISMYETQVRRRLDSGDTPLPEYPDRPGIVDWMTSLHEGIWAGAYS